MIGEEMQKFLNEVPLVKDLGVPLALMIIQLFIIDRLLRRMQELRDRKQWTSLRCLFYSSAFSFYEKIMSDVLLWLEDFIAKLEDIRSKQILTEEDVQNLASMTTKTAESTFHARSEFFNAIQTCAPSLRPSVGPRIDELLNLYNHFEGYLGEIRYDLKLFDKSLVPNRDASSKLLSGIWSKTINFDIILLSVKDFSERFCKIVEEEEQIFFYKGSFFPRDDVNFFTESDERMAKYKEESSQIRRVTPILNFFDAKNDAHNSREIS